MPFGRILLFHIWNFTQPCIFQYHNIIVTGPAKRDQVGTKYTISQNGTYFEFCVQYSLYVSCNMLPMKLFIDGEMFTYIALADHQLHMMQQI